MKKITAMILAALMVLSLASFAGAEAADTNILIAYFSMPEADGADASSGASRIVEDGEVIGNVQYLANAIAQATGGELFAIETVQAYPISHQPLIQHADYEKSESARPNLATALENLDAYDTIFLGYPNWWAELPMALYTFLETYDLSGKTIVPFCPHGGSGFSGTVDTIAQLQPNATVHPDGLAISRNDVQGSNDRVAAWVESLNLGQ